MFDFLIRAFTFTPWGFVANLKYLLAGMLGIFIIMLVIMLVTALLNRLTRPKDKEED